MAAVTPSDTTAAPTAMAAWPTFEAIFAAGLGGSCRSTACSLPSATPRTALLVPRPDLLDLLLTGRDDLLDILLDGESTAAKRGPGSRRRAAEPDA